MPDYKFWSDYNLYLMSEEWAVKRQKVLTRARYVCEVCHRAEAQHIHHLTYNHVFDERLYELQAVCFRCHDRLHAGKLSQNF
jgi:5-methylcytosine-specific restriction endonuclease McrA